MNLKLSFKANPPIPFHTLEYHLKYALKNKFYEPNIDSDTKQKIVYNSANRLIELLDIPDDYKILFLSSSLPLNQAFSQTIVGNIALADTNGIRESLQGIWDDFFWLHINGDDSRSQVINDFSLLCFEQIDPMSGKIIHLNELLRNHEISAASLIHCDISNSAPFEPLDFENIHSFFLQSQFGLGILPDTCIWIARNDIFDKITKAFFHLKAAIPASININHRIVNFNVDIEKLFAMGMVVADMLNRGLKNIRNEIKYKSIIIYNALKESSSFKPLIDVPLHQSKNIICATTMAPSKEVIDFFTKKGIELDIYQDRSDETIIRIANFPVHSKEQTEYLADLISEF